MTNDNTPDQGKPASGIKRRGFASISPERRREIASMGGKASHLSGNAHQFNSEEAREAGKRSRMGKRKAGDLTPAAKEVIERLTRAKHEQTPATEAIRRDS